MPMTESDEDACLAAMDIWESVPGRTWEKLAARTHRPTDSSN